MNIDAHQTVIKQLTPWHLCLLGICIISMASSETAIAQAPATLSPADATQVRREIQAWLECGLCDEAELTPVKARGAAAVGSLRFALLSGPSDGDIELLRAHLAKSYERLRDHSTTPESSSDSQAKKTFVKTYIDNFVATYRIRAAQALGAIGTEEAKQALDEAKKLKNPKDVDRAITEAREKIH